MKRYTRQGASSAIAMLYTLVLALTLATTCVEATSSLQSSPDVLRRVVARSQQSMKQRASSSSFWKARQVSDELESWEKRQESAAGQDAIATQGETDPFGAATAADNEPWIKGNYSGNDNSAYSLTPTTGDFQQLPWNVNVYFQQSAATNGSEDGGWQELPDTPGFILNRSVSISNSNNSGSGIMPFYITENTLTPSTVKRAIMLWPGKVRFWKKGERERERDCVFSRLTCTTSLLYSTTTAP